jgi:hypothetical protein
MAQPFAGTLDQKVIVFTHTNAVKLVDSLSSQAEAENRDGIAQHDLWRSLLCNRVSLCTYMVEPQGAQEYYTSRSTTSWDLEGQREDRVEEGCQYPRTLQRERG